MTEYYAGKASDPTALNRRTFVSVSSLTNWVSVGMGFYFVFNGPVRVTWWLVPVAATAILVNAVALLRFVRYTTELQARLLAVAATAMSFVIWVGLPALFVLLPILDARYPGLLHTMSRNKAGGNLGIAFVVILFSPTYLSIYAHKKGSKIQ
ncbi:hypothetical protein WNZ14_13830 [Hoeflea sp. AS60]|uniref:hypothetical protein n=1 Tax=Hoeflea sp. AS60 TaxID=3135780 RepID=UPI0031816A3B